jgi:hypothetical protein
MRTHTLPIFIFSGGKQIEVLVPVFPCLSVTSSQPSRRRVFKRKGFISLYSTSANTYLHQYLCVEQKKKERTYLRVGVTLGIIILATVLFHRSVSSGFLIPCRTRTVLLAFVCIRFLVQRLIVTFFKTVTPQNNRAKATKYLQRDP